MQIKDVTDTFLDNIVKHKRTVVFHWTATNTAKEAIDYLKARLNGKGTVGYNYVVEKNGDIFMLANPCNAWMHNSAKGTEFDKNTISISFANIGDGNFTERQTNATVELINNLQKQFDIVTFTNHHILYPSKPDFPDDVWEKLKIELKI